MKSSMIVRPEFAGVVGIGPTLQVLETRGLPLTDTPIFGNYTSMKTKFLLWKVFVSAGSE